MITKYVTFEVVVTIEYPEDADLDDAQLIEAAMGSLLHSTAVNAGDLRNPIWARVTTEVNDEDAEVSDFA